MRRTLFTGLLLAATLLGIAALALEPLPPDEALVEARL